jgi:hypothetical protein
MCWEMIGVRLEPGGDMRDEMRRTEPELSSLTCWRYHTGVIIEGVVSPFSDSSSRCLLSGS